MTRVTDALVKRAIENAGALANNNNEKTVKLQKEAMVIVNRWSHLQPQSLRQLVTLLLRIADAALADGEQELGPKVKGPGTQSQQT